MFKLTHELLPVDVSLARRSQSFETFLNRQKHAE